MTDLNTQSNNVGFSLNRWLLQWATVLVVVAILLVEIFKYHHLGWVVGIVVYFQFLWKLQWIEHGVNVNAQNIFDLNNSSNIVLSDRLQERTSQ